MKKGALAIGMMADVLLFLPQKHSTHTFVFYRATLK
jgi:hypothetical protein